MTERRSVSYPLDDLAQLASELGLAWQRVDQDRLDVNVAADATLTFRNGLGDTDSLVGFDGTPWHSHGVVQFMTGANTSIECDALDILIGLRSGDLLIVSQYQDGTLKNRWLAHKDEPLDLQYMDAGGELRAFRLPDADTDAARVRPGGAA